MRHLPEPVARGEIPVEQPDLNVAHNQRRAAAGALGHRRLLKPEAWQRLGGAVVGGEG